MRQEYYYQHMAKGEQSAYRSMLDGFEVIAPGFPVLSLGGRELFDLFFGLRLDHPLIFYVERFNYRYANNPQYVQLIPQYVFGKKKIKEMKLALESRINRLVQQIGDLSSEEEEKYIHDFIYTSVIYDRLREQYFHEIIGPLQQGVGVCEGIAKTVKILRDRMGIECVIAISQADPEQGIRYRHVWDLVKLKNMWYHLGATFNSSLGCYEQERFDYYGLDDEMMLRDHQSLAYGMSACPDGSRFCCRENRLSLTKAGGVSGRMKTVLRKRQSYSVFHWRGGTLNREVLERTVQTASEVAREKGKYIRLSASYRQAAMEIAVLESQLQETACREEANEGELDGREK